MKKITSLLLVLLNVFLLNAQSTLSKEELKTYKKSVRKANIYYQNFDYKNSIEEYKNAFNISDTSFLLNYKLGLSFLFENQSDSSLIYLNKALSIKQKDSLQLWYHLAVAYQDAYNFSKAALYYNKCLNSWNYSDKELIKKRLTECKAGEEIVKDTLDWMIKRLPDSINSPYVDYGFYILNDDLAVFSSKRPENIGGYKSPDDGDYYEDIFFARIKNQEFYRCYNPKRPINSEDPDACVGISPDGKRIFIYSDINKGDIFYTYYQDGKWIKPLNFRTINSAYRETCLAFTQNEEYIYFAGNRKNSLGGLDIFYIKKINDSTYSEPVNLGANINSPYDENWVYINPTNDTLYFSSKGHNSMGGYDLFRAVKNKQGVWEKAQNLGYPVNTPYDDMNFFPAGDKFYFSSIRKNSTTKNDIYLAYKPIRYANLKIIVQQDDTLRVIHPDIQVFSGDEPMFGKCERANLLESNYSLQINKKYQIKIKAEDFLPLSDSVFFVKDTVLNYSLTLDPAIFIQSFKIYYITNKYKIDPKYHQGLDELVNILKKYPGYKLEIAGHTDNVGSDTYNRKLANKRASEVYEYLISKGITPERIKYTSYAASKPCVANDSEEHRFLNRRVEFYIIQ